MRRAGESEGFNFIEYLPSTKNKDEAVDKLDIRNILNAIGDIIKWHGYTFPTVSRVYLEELKKNWLGFKISKWQAFFLPQDLIEPDEVSAYKLLALSAINGVNFAGLISNRYKEYTSPFQFIEHDYSHIEFRNSEPQKKINFYLHLEKNNLEKFINTFLLHFPYIEELKKAIEKSHDNTYQLFQIFSLMFDLEALKKTLTEDIVFSDDPKFLYLIYDCTFEKGLINSIFILSYLLKVKGYQYLELHLPRTMSYFKNDIELISAGSIEKKLQLFKLLLFLAIEDSKNVKNDNGFVEIDWHVSKVFPGDDKISIDGSLFFILPEQEREKVEFFNKCASLRKFKDAIIEDILNSTDLELLEEIYNATLRYGDIIHVLAYLAKKNDPTYLQSRLPSTIKYFTRKLALLKLDFDSDFYIINLQINLFLLLANEFYLFYHNQEKSMLTNDDFDNLVRAIIEDLLTMDQKSPTIKYLAEKMRAGRKTLHSFFYTLYTYTLLTMSDEEIHSLFKQTSHVLKTIFDAKRAKGKNTSPYFIEAAQLNDSLSPNKSAPTTRTKLLGLFPRSLRKEKPVTKMYYLDPLELFYALLKDIQGLDEKQQGRFLSLIRAEPNLDPYFLLRRMRCESNAKMFLDEGDFANCFKVLSKQ